MCTNMYAFYSAAFQISAPSAFSFCFRLKTPPTSRAILSAAAAGYFFLYRRFSAMVGRSSRLWPKQPRVATRTWSQNLTDHKQSPMNRANRPVLRRFKDVPELRWERTSAGQLVLQQELLKGFALAPPFAPSLGDSRTSPSCGWTGQSALFIEAPLVIIGNCHMM